MNNNLKIKISVDKQTGNVKLVSGEFEELSKSVNKTDKGVDSFNKNLTGMATKFAGIAASTYAVTESFSALIDNIDTMTKLDSQVKLVTNSTADLAKTQSLLYSLSKETRTGLEATTELYARLYRSTRDLGTSQEDLLKFTKVVSQSLAISGASAGEANSAMLQLGQAMASGVLRGDEFNSISENGSKLMDVLSKSLNVTRGELREMAQDGKLTSEVLANAMVEGASDVDREFNNMNITIGQSTEVLNNATLKISKVADDFIGISEKLSETNIGFASILDTIANAIQKTTQNRSFAEAEERLEEINEIMIDMPIQARKGYRLLNEEVQELTKTLGYYHKEAETGSINVGKVAEKTAKEKKDLLKLEENGQKLISQLYKELAEKEKAYLEFVTSDSDKINNKYLEIQKTFGDMFTNDQMMDFYAKWGKELDEINKKNKESIQYEGIGSKDWTAGLESSAKALANMGNAFSDIGQEQSKWSKFNKENEATEEDKATHLDNQLQGYGNLAGVMSGMYDEGSSAANAMIQMQTALSIVSGITAIANAMANGDGYTAVARGLAVAAALASFGWQGGSGGGSDISNSEAAANSQDLNQFKSYQRAGGIDFEDFESGLKSATKALEKFGNSGTSASENISITLNQIERYQAGIDYYDRIASPVQDSGITDYSKIDWDFGATPMPTTIADNEKQIEAWNAEIGKLIELNRSQLTDAISEAVDFSEYTPSQAQEALNAQVPDGFNIEHYRELQEQLNQIGIEAKLLTAKGADLATVDAKLAEGIGILTNSTYEAGQNFEDLIDILDEVTVERLSLEDELARLGATRNEIRAIDLLLIDESNQALQKEIWAKQDLIESTEKSATALDMFSGITDNINNRLYTLQGKTTSASSISSSIASLGSLAPDGMSEAVNNIFSSMDRYTNERQASIKAALDQEREDFDSHQQDLRTAHAEANALQLDSIQSQISLLESQTDIVHSLREYAKGLVNEFSTFSNNTDYLGSSFQSALSAFNSSSTSNNSSALQSSTNAYLTSAKLSAQNSSDYNHLVARTANRLSGAGVLQDTTLANLYEQQEDIQDFTVATFDYQTKQDELFKKLDQENIDWLEDIGDDINFQSDLLNFELDTQTLSLNTISETLNRLETITSELKEVQEEQLAQNKQIATNTQESRFAS